VYQFRKCNNKKQKTRNISERKNLVSTASATQSRCYSTFPFMLFSFYNITYHNNDRSSLTSFRSTESRMRVHTRRFFRSQPSRPQQDWPTRPTRPITHIHCARARWSEASGSSCVHMCVKCTCVRTSYGRVRPHPGSARRLMNDQTRFYASRGA